MIFAKSIISLCILAESLSRSTDVRLFLPRTNDALDSRPMPSATISNVTNAAEANLYVSPQTQEATIIESILALALDISGTQWEQRNFGNVVQSPISISALLSMILLAARGSSHAELKRALRLPNNLPDAIIHETYQNILGSLNQATAGVNIRMGSRLFMQDGSKILGTYTQTAQALYDTQVRVLDFKNDPLGATKQVNHYVEESTQLLIKDLISPPFRPDTKFVAVNTIYFKGAWKFPFSKSLTRQGTFNTGDRNITMPMMSNLLNVPYLSGEHVGFDMVSLPYEGGKYEMVIIIPTGNSGTTSLLAVELTLDAKSIEQQIALMKLTKVAVTIPKMKLTQKMYLKEDLQRLDVRSIFDPSLADLGRLTDANDVYLNDVVHEAVIEITEEGTTAAAASAGTYDRTGDSKYFALNKPSIILIRDVASGLPLFYSRVVVPEPIYDEQPFHNDNKH